MEFYTLLAATEAESAGGIGALGINLQSFLFQLVTFVVVLLILRKYVYGKLVDTLEARRTEVLKGLEQASESEQRLKEAEVEVTKLINQARKEAEGIVSVAHKEGAKMIEEAEEKASKKAEHIVAQAESRLTQEVSEARIALRKETAQLVADATEKILRQKLDTKTDSKLIETALKEAK